MKTCRRLDETGAPRRGPRLTVRLSAPIMAVSCLPLLVGVLAAWSVHQSHRTASKALALNVGSMRAAEELAIGLRDVRAHLDRFLLTGDAASLLEAPRYQRDMDHWLAEARRTAVTREQELIAHLTRSYATFFEEVGRLECEVPGRRPAAVRGLIARTGEVLRPAQEYLDYNEEEIHKSSEENLQQADRVVAGLLLLGVCGPVAGLLAGYGVAGAVTRSIVRLSVPIRDAAGKLKEVVGPLTISAGLGLEEFEAVLRRLAGQVGDVVERLQRSQGEALRAEQLAAVGQMAAGVAHELRNPLTSMKILVQSAAERPDGAGLAGRDLAVLEEEITRLEHLTATLLDFARPPQPEKRAFEVRGLLEDTADLVAARAGQQDVRLECAFPGQPVRLQADVGQVRQVVLNLLLNALEAVPEGGTVRLELDVSPGPAGTVPLSSSPDDQPDSWVTIRVADTGPGLPADLGQDIWSPFVSTKLTGIGLGLSICKRIVEAHGGEIEASNGAGGGAVFTARLPLSQVTR